MRMTHLCIAGMPRPGFVDRRTCPRISHPIDYPQSESYIDCSVYFTPMIVSKLVPSGIDARYSQEYKYAEIDIGRAARLLVFWLDSNGPLLVAHYQRFYVRSPANLTKFPR